jgi:hypothetical protein
MIDVDHWPHRMPTDDFARGSQKFSTFLVRLSDPAGRIEVSIAAVSDGRSSQYRGLVKKLPGASPPDFVVAFACPKEG